MSNAALLCAGYVEKINLFLGEGDYGLINWNAESTVIIGGILAGATVSFGVFLAVGFVCVQKNRHRRRHLQQQQLHCSNSSQMANGNINCHQNSSTSSSVQSQSKPLLQVTYKSCFILKMDGLFVKIGEH